MDTDFKEEFDRLHIEHAEHKKMLRDLAALIVRNNRSFEQDLIGHDYKTDLSEFLREYSEE